MCRWCPTTDQAARWHDSPAAAMATLEELEETARLMLLAPHTEPLRATDIDELRATFGARW